MITAVEAQTASQDTTITQDVLEAFTNTYMFDLMIAEASKVGKTTVPVHVSLFGQTEGGITLNLLLLERYGYTCTLDGNTVTISWENPQPEDFTKTVSVVVDLAQNVWEQYKHILEENM